MKVMASV